MNHKTTRQVKKPCPECGERTLKHKRSERMVSGKKSNNYICDNCGTKVRLIEP